MVQLDEAHVWTDEELSKLERRIRAEYKKASKELQGTIDDYFAKLKKRDEEMKALLDAGEITENHYKQWRLAQIGRGERYEALRDKIAERMTRANETAVAYVNDATPGIYSLNRNYAAYTIEQVAGNADFTLWDEHTVKRLLVEQPDLMPYYPKKKAVKRGIDLAWGKKQITNVVTSGILQGKSIKGLADDLQARIPTMNRDSAIRTARTAVTGAQNAGRIDSYTAAQKMGIKLKKSWLATLDGRTRHEHALLDGQTVDTDKPFKVDGYELMFPGDPSGPAHLTYNCRCTLIAAVDGVDTSDAKRRARDPETGESVLIENMTYAEWAGWKEKAQKRPVFTPAESLEEAEKYAQRFVNAGREYKGEIFGQGKVSYKGLSVESANIINEALFDVFEKYNVPRFANIDIMNFRKNIWKGKEGAPAAYRSVLAGEGYGGELFINPKILKSRKSFSEYEKQGENAFLFCEKNLDRFTGKDRELVEKYIKAGRQLISSEADDGFKATIYHEFGHHIENQLMTKDKDAIAAVKDGFDEYAIKISGYATKSAGEYIAESHCAYMIGREDLIDPRLKKYFDGMIK